MGRKGPVEIPTAVGAEWVDHHCHLPPGSEGDAVVAAAAAVGVTRLVDVGTDRARSLAAIASAERHPGVVFATAGVHPHDAAEGTAPLPDLLAHPRVVAVGECGLDYHYDHAPRDVQRRVFAAQIGLANERSLPLIVHSREAWDDTFSVLDVEGTPARTVFHCFTGGPAELDRALEQGAMISFSGVVTFANAEDNRDAARRCPLDRILVETDSPYLSPVPVRGRRNEPAHLPHVGAAIASVHAIDLAACARATRESTTRFYGLDSA